MSDKRMVLVLVVIGVVAFTAWVIYRSRIPLPTTTTQPAPPKKPALGVEPRPAIPMVSTQVDIVQVPKDYVS